MQASVWAGVAAVAAYSAAATVVALASGWFVWWQRTRLRGGTPLTALLGLVAVWWAGVGLAATATSTATAGVWFRIGHAIGLLLPPIWLATVSALTGGVRGIRAAAVGAVAAVAVVVSNPLHGRLWTEFRLESVGGGSVPVATPGAIASVPSTWLLGGYAVLVVLAGLAAIGRRFARHADRMQGPILAGSGLVALGAIVVAHGQVGPLAAVAWPLPGMVAAPTAWLAAGALTLAAVWRSDRVPAAGLRKRVVDATDDAVLAVDEDDRVVDANPAARTLADVEEPIGEPLDAAFPAVAAGLADRDADGNQGNATSSGPPDDADDGSTDQLMRGGTAAASTGAGRETPGPTVHPTPAESTAEQPPAGEGSGDSSAGDPEPKLNGGSESARPGDGTGATPTRGPVIEPTGNDRYVELVVRPFDDRLPADRAIVLHDVTRRERREGTLEALQAATWDLLRTETVDTVCQHAVAATRTLLELEYATVHLWDDDAGCLRPVAATDPVESLFEEVPDVSSDEGLIGATFVAGETRVCPDVRTAEADDLAGARSPIRGAILVPLGDRGMLVAGTTDRIDPDDARVRFAEILAASVTVALSRAERERELQRQNERLEQFASVVSHDLRSPLSVAHGYLRLAREELGADGPHEYLEDAEAALDRMEGLIEDLLALARADEPVTDPESISLSSVAETAWSHVETGQTLLETEDRRLVADRSRLLQLLENLFRNAVEHGDANGVRVEATPDGFAVADDGRGIPPDERDHVFEQGYTTSEEGTGFGLAIAAEIVEAHGWSIRATEGSLGGARFVISGVDREVEREPEEG